MKDSNSYIFEKLLESIKNVISFDVIRHKNFKFPRKNPISPRLAPSLSRGKSAVSTQENNYLCEGVNNELNSVLFVAYAPAWSKSILVVILTSFNGRLSKMGRFPGYGHEKFSGGQDFGPRFLLPSLAHCFSPPPNMNFVPRGLDSMSLSQAEGHLCITKVAEVYT